MKKDNAKTPHQSRQLVVHGHVSIGGRVINIPGYIVKKDEESKIDLRSQFMNSPQNIPTQLKIKKQYQHGLFFHLHSCRNLEQLMQVDHHLKNYCIFYLHNRLTQ